jgi:multiple sugar transport system permease protein
LGAVRKQETNLPAPDFSSPNLPVGSVISRRRKAWGNHATAYLFLLPGISVFFLTVIFPILKSIQISFFKWSVFPGIHSPFLGLGNYSRALHDPVFWRALVNSGFYMLVTVPPQIILGLLAAMLLNNKIRGRATFRVLIYLPVITSWVVVTLLFLYLFSGDGGFFNWILKNVLHLVDQDVQWFGSRWPAMLAMAALGIWKGIGWSMIIFLAALQSVNPELVEAAAIDGAGPIRRFFAVIIPAVRRTTTFISMMLVIGGFNVFIQVYLMTQGGPMGATEVLLTYMYKQAFTYLDFGYGSAIAFLLTAIILVLSGVQWRFFRPDDDS